MKPKKAVFGVVSAISIAAALMFAGNSFAQDAAQIAAGKKIFEETAGGVGCASCHGMDGKGDYGPANAGASKDSVISALGGIEDMSFIQLTEEELDAVVAYLATL